MPTLDLLLLPRRAGPARLFKLALRRIGAVLALLVGLAVLHEIAPHMVDADAAQAAASALSDGEV